MPTREELEREDAEIERVRSTLEKWKVYTWVFMVGSGAVFTAYLNGAAGFTNYILGAIALAASVGGGIRLLETAAKIQFAS